MKKCIKCDFKTENNDYKICPICGENLDISKDKREYIIGLSAEDSFDTTIELTYEEAKIVKKVAEKLSKESTGYCGSFWIDFE
jgi:RNA polymerase subunit RPABC4/transcription elongation factor Spt4